MTGIEFYALLAFIIAGAMYRSFKLGKREGTIDTIEWLLEVGKLDVNDDELFTHYD